jgi:hypothetical protein
MEPDETQAIVSEVEPQDQPSSTLLPAHIANVVSLLTRSSSLYLRLGTFIGGIALDGARVTTLTGLELSRAVIESIIYKAGKDVSTRSTGDLGRVEAEGLLERSIATLHATITNISFAASTGFYISSTALESAGDISQLLLGTLDSILGSTDSSRAIASIITLIRREFENPATGQPGEKIGISDLIMGICGLALLQRWCKQLTDAEVKDRKYEEVVWDVVVLDDGRRVDVSAEISHQKSPTRTDPISFLTTSGDEIVQSIQGEDIADDFGEELPEINLKQGIIQSLPADASVSITTSTTTTKIVTVEITGAQPPDLAPPPGVEIIEESAHHIAGVDLNGQILTNQQKRDLLIPRYRAVYRVVKNKFRGTDIEARGTADDTEQITDNLQLMDTEHLNTAIRNPNLAILPGHFSEIKTRAELSQSSTHPSDASSLDSPSFTPQSVDSGDEKVLGFSVIPIPTANRKRSRKPMNSSSSVSGSENPTPPKLSGSKSPISRKPKLDRATTKPAEKKGSFRNALKKGSGTTLSNLWNKENPQESALHSKPLPPRPIWGAPAATPSPKPVPRRNSSIIPARDAPRAPQRGNPNYFSSRDLGVISVPDNVARSHSRASYYSIHESRRDSMVSQTDTYSLHSTDARPTSPTAFKTHLRAKSSLLRAKSEKNISTQPLSPSKNHQRSKSYVPSIYTLKTNNSATSLIIASRPPRSAFDDSTTLQSLVRTGEVDGLFPQHHLIRNIARFVRFASASYGANFLRVMGIATSTANGMTKEVDTKHHHEHHSFSNHTQLPADTILLSSFVDPQGGTDSTGHTGTGVPMVHFVSLDHDSKAVVLTCRGTLGFEDVLTDMTCDYDELVYRGKAYKVHMGIHASAQRLLSSRVLVTIKAALEEFPEYGLVLCGHSLGGAVSAVLAIMISEPSMNGPSFVTSFSQHCEQFRGLLTMAKEEGIAPPNQQKLPPGRPIHVYAYGPPATLSPSLRLATRGLITTIINSQDLVPYLSLGVLHDLQAVALAFKTDDSGAKGEVKKRVWEGLQGTFKDRWYQTSAGSRGGGANKDEDDQWAYAALKALRASMLSPKLLPPGEVFLVESMPVLRREAFAKDDGGNRNLGGNALGRPATRSVLRYIRNVERRFGEIRFGGGMLLDHSPGRYEASLGALRKGVLTS